MSTRPASLYFAMCGVSGRTGRAFIACPRQVPNNSVGAPAAGGAEEATGCLASARATLTLPADDWSASTEATDIGMEPKLEASTNGCLSGAARLPAEIFADPS